MNEKIKMSDFLEHHGILGQKWGRWNDETTRKYLGSEKSLDSDSVKERHGLSTEQYNKIRERTLKSNDPKVVAKGMSLLTDKELNDKISRLERENKVREIASKQRINEANAKKAELERRQKTLPYKLGETATKAIVKQVTSQFVNKTIKPVADSVASSLGKTGVKTIDSMKKAIKEEKNRNRKDETKSSDKATKVKSEIGKEAVNTIRKSWKTAPKNSRIGMKKTTSNNITPKKWTDQLEDIMKED